MPKKDVPITYRKSFLAKYIQSDDRVKEVYGIIKNKLMSIKGIKSRISWFYDAFNIGRINFAKLSVRGKYVALYLALDTKDYEENIYHQEDVSDRRRFKDTPFKIHVKSNRTIKYAFRLIDDLIKKYNLKTLKEIPKENYYLDFEEDAPLIERGLIKLEDSKEVLPKKEEKFSYSSSEYVTMDSFQSNKNKEIESYKQIKFVNDSKVFVKERKSFEARLHQSSKDIQSYYSNIKNALLSFIKVKSNLTWKYESFTIGRSKLAKIQIRGKYLVLFLNLDPQKYIYRGSRCEDATGHSIFNDTPVFIRIKNNERLNIALDLIKDLKKRFLLDEGFIKEQHEFNYDFKSNKELIDKGLIKVFAKFGDYSNEIEAQLGTEIKSKKNNNFPVYKEEKRFVLTTDENNNFIETYETVKILLQGERDIVYLDIIDKFFNDGDVVDLNSLKEKNILSEEIEFYKVIYRGGDFKKKLTIKAHASSPIVEKILHDSGSLYIIDLGD